MLKRIKGLKDALWALAIGAALLLLFVGFLIAAFTPYRGDRDRPVMDLRAGQEQSSAPAGDDSQAQTAALQPDGTLHSLAETADAGQSYLDGLCYLLDSSLINLRGTGLVNGQIWSSESGTLSMSITGEWNIRYPGDSSFISPASAASVKKPAVLVIGVGSDGLLGLSKDAFVTNYVSLIRSLADASPDTRIICLSLCSVTASYAGMDGLSKDAVAEINGWIRTVCTETGAYYADLSGVLYDDGYLKSEYADGSGRCLNSAGLRELLQYLRTHSLQS